MKRLAFLKQRVFLFDALHLFVLCGFAVAQPLLDLLARHPEFFVARQAPPIDIVLMVFSLCFLLPMLLVLIEGAFCFLHPWAQKWAHHVIVAGLVTLIVIPMLKPIEHFSVSVFVVERLREIAHLQPPRLMGLPAKAIIAASASTGMIATFCYTRFQLARTLLSILSPAIILFPALFFLDSNILKIINPAQAAPVPVTPVYSTTPVVLVIFDELPLASLLNAAGKIDKSLFPNFAAFAEESTWFRNATTVADDTVNAVPAILTGKYPKAGLLPEFSDHPQNLFTLLQHSHMFNVMEVMTRLCTIPQCSMLHILPHLPLRERVDTLRHDLEVVYGHIVLPEHFVSHLPSIHGTWGNFIGRHGAHESHAVFREFVDAIVLTEQPGLHVLHVLLPHVPWVHLPSGKRYSAGQSDEGLGLVNRNGRAWPQDLLRAVQGHQRHILQVGYVDTLFGEVIKRLKETALYDHSLIMFTADHGASFRPGITRRRVLKDNLYDIASIPLFIKQPRQHQGEISDRNAETIDLLPTIAGVLSRSVPWPIDGHALFETTMPQRIGKQIFAFHEKTFLRFNPDLQALDAAVRRKVALFGSEAGYDGVIRGGNLHARRLQWLGRAVPDAAKTSSIEVCFDSPEMYHEVDLQSDWMPIQITGKITGHIPSEEASSTKPYDLAIAVNGTIQGMTQTFQSEQDRFSVFVPESVFREGENNLDVFIVSSKRSGEIPLIRTRECQDR